MATVHLVVGAIGAKRFVAFPEHWLDATCSSERDLIDTLAGYLQRIHGVERPEAFRRAAAAAESLRPHSGDTVQVTL